MGSIIDTDTDPGAVPPEKARPGTDTLDAIVVGAGQAGLSVGHHLARRGLRFRVLDARDRVGDAWRTRWDSLRLFTPAVFNGLDGMPFPGPRFYFPTKDEMADYLEAYADRFSLPVRTGMRVDRVWRNGDVYSVSAGGERFDTHSVIVAMSNYQRARVPAFAADLSSDIVQIHSVDYHNPGQLRDGPVLIVGAGNSGAEIAKDVAPRHSIFLSGRDTGHLPFRIEGRLARLGLARLMLRGVFHRLLTVNTPLGRRARPVVLHKGGPLIRVQPDDLRRLGVERVARVSGVENGRPVLEDGRVLEVTNVIWCTGFRPGFDWIDLPVLEGDNPAHGSGVARGEPGLFFVGLHFLHALSSAMIHGVGRDADRIAAAVAERASARRAA